MKSLLLFTVLLLSICYFGCSKKEATSDLFSVELITVQHEKFSFAELTSKKASVIIFLQPECPFCNSYGKTLRELDSVFQKQNITLIGVIAGKNYPENEIIAYSEKNRLHFPMLLDPEFVLQKKLRATITPEVFLVSNTGEIKYRGMIDNWGYEIGKVRPIVTAHYLTDAVSAFLQNKPVSPDSTKAIGCYIE
ncbi:MAG: redoxin domain-containing protein [Chitinophagales bacterium]